MMTSSNGNIFRITGPLCGEFTGPGEFPAQRPVTRSFDVFFDLRLNKRLSKQPWGWWFETPSWSLWRHCNAVLYALQWNLYKATTKFCGLSRQVVSHDRENKHDFVMAMPDKWWNLCVFSETWLVFSYRFHCIILIFYFVITRLIVKPLI